MTKELETYRLERTVISQANELTDLRTAQVNWIGKYNDAEKRCQDVSGISQRAFDLIIAISQVLDDDELAYEEQVEAIRALIYEQEETEG